jgi:uncharacterized protein
MLLSRSGSIRSPSFLPQVCTGSIVHAQWRYYHFDLAELGYYPQGFSRRSGKTRGLEYFEEWSYHSLHNREIYNGYLAELKRVRPLLVAWYMKNHVVDEETAQRYTDLALSRISDYGFGSYYYYWEPEELVPFTQNAIAGEYEKLLDSLKISSEIQKYNSLRRLLVHRPPNQVIDKLANSISQKNSLERSESPLSNAIYSPAHVRILTEAGFDPNHQNIFGKTPLYYAIQYSQHETVKVLLDSGADVNHTYQREEDDPWNCLGITQWGRTPLMHAAQHSDLEMIKLLIKYNANLHAKDVLGGTALDYAQKNGKKENEEYLSLELSKKSI